MPVVFAVRGLLNGAGSLLTSGHRLPAPSRTLEQSPIREVSVVVLQQIVMSVANRIVFVWGPLDAGSYKCAACRVSSMERRGRATVRHGS